jgi:hypothetical protein
MGGITALGVFGAAGGAYAEDSKQVQMLHWWTSAEGSRAERDQRGGRQAGIQLERRTRSGRRRRRRDDDAESRSRGRQPPTTPDSGYYAMDYSEAGKLPILPLATKGDG